ncbi:MAG: glycosyltransferase [Nostocales cyanobacterium]|nr:MAG: glycosyltransferase [Nostocales cyanobacterium]TAF16755.1 MAG: glycosyltransferase [Nostocales cyanobacterium]
MKILQIVPSISLIYGGPSQMILGLSPALAKAGTKVTILTTNTNGDSGQESLDVPLNLPIQQDGYEIIYFRCAPFRRYKFSVDLLKWLKDNAKDFDIAHLHALYSPVISAAAMICRQQNIPYILRPLGTLDPADLQKKKQLKKIYTALWERANIAGAAAIHFTSEQEAKVSERFGVNTKDLVIPLGVIPQQKSEEDVRIKLGIPEDKTLILFMSRIEPKKGLDLLIPALNQLLKMGFDFHFVLAGTNPQDPSYEDKIKDEITNSPLKECTTMTGFVTGKTKIGLLQTADLFVLPSYYENFGIAVAEAMVAGTPVVISDQVHIYQQIIDSESGWVGKTDVNSIVNLLTTALSDPQECQRRGLNAQEYALNNFSWEAIAQQMIRAYQEIITMKK